MISSQTIFEELCSTGSSGSLLYYTIDGEFIVKTISRNEYKFMQTMIAEYFFYIKQNPLTYLPKLLGAYVLKRKIKKNTTKIYFIVMSNVFATDHHIDLRFDLKGSKIGRKVLRGTTDDTKVFSNGDMALKDLDFNKSKERVHIGQKREIVLEQIKKDIEFLYSINSNDYSLLLGIHCIKDSEKVDLSRVNTIKTIECEKDELSFLSANTKDFLPTNTADKESVISSEKAAVDRINKLRNINDFEDGGILSENKKRIYYFGIIDILTKFSTSKRFEYYFKKLRYCSEDMSCIPPFDYKNRFYNYLKTVFAEEETLENSSDKNNNNNNIKKKIQNVDKYGAISSSLYKNYQEDENDEKFTDEESMQKL
jgi:1-phosphatidylinositol-4-phosphate 5-kinase